MPLYLDDTTLMDLSIFEVRGDNSIFSRFNTTRTRGGERYLQQYFATPFNDLETIQAVQSLIATFALRVESWPTEIGNGTVFIMEKFLKYHFTHFNGNMHFLDRVTYRAINREDYYMLKFSTKVLGDFFRGIGKIQSIVHDVLLPVQYRYMQEKMSAILEGEAIKKLARTEANHSFTSKEIFYYCFHLLRLRSEIHDLMDIYFRLEAWFSMAKAVKDYGLTFPEFVESDEPYLDVNGLYHFLSRHFFRMMNLLVKNCLNGDPKVMSFTYTVTSYGSAQGRFYNLLRVGERPIGKENATKMRLKPGC